MAAKKGPTKGPRVMVKLPFGSAKTGGGKPAGQYVLVKQGVAKLLGLKVVDKIPTKQVKFKTASGTATVTRKVQGSYRQRSVRLIFSSPRTVPGSSGTYKTVSLPIPSGVTLDDVMQYFHTGGGKNEKVIALITPAGVRHQWDESTLGPVK